MVPMSTKGELLYKDMRETLLRQVATLSAQNNLQEAFAAWLLPHQNKGLSVNGPVNVSLSHIGAQKTYQDVAVFGFAAASGTIDHGQQNTLNVGLRWLAGREPFLDGLPTGICLDAVALLGIALGTKYLGDDSTREAIVDWMKKFIVKCYDMRGVHDWQRCLFVAAQEEIGNKIAMTVPSDPSVADVRVALRSRGLLLISEKTVYEQDEADALILLKEDALKSVDLIRAVFRLAALDWIFRSLPTITMSHPTVDELSQLLRRVPAGLRRWTWEKEARTPNAEPQKWHIDNEYHVQNLLWNILAPIFPDLNDEEYTPAIGQLQPRADICIPSLKLIIEIKFMRANKAPKELIEEMAADASLYLTAGSNYKSIISFIWDDSRRTEEHDMLVRGLST